MKIAVCLPSLNEAKRIEQITSIVDTGLSLIRSKYPEIEVKILNFDSQSNDNTPKIFLKTATQNPKESFITQKKGKGVNILSFCKFVVENKIDYCISIDSDVTSATPEWIEMFLEPLFLKKADYVTPIYKRSPFEGSSTNHFAFPLIYALTGQIIRQPIAGDFAFTNEIAQIFLDKKFFNVQYIQNYGIDIFMTLSVILSNKKIHQIELDKKIHAPSFQKMEYMFPQIAASTLFTLAHQTMMKKTLNRKNIQIENDILSNVHFKHKEQALLMKENAIQKLKTLTLPWCSHSFIDEYIEKSNINTPKDTISQLWIHVLLQWINHYYTININEKNIEKLGNELLPFFVLRAVNFWFWAETVSINKVEQSIVKQAENLRSYFINTLS